MVDIKDCDNNGCKHELDETTTSIKCELKVWDVGV
jgi:hypothetical protein